MRSGNLFLSLIEVAQNKKRIQYHKDNVRKHALIKTKEKNKNIIKQTNKGNICIRWGCGWGIEMTHNRLDERIRKLARKMSRLHIYLIVAYRIALLSSKFMICCPYVGIHQHFLLDQLEHTFLV